MASEWPKLTDGLELLRTYSRIERTIFLILVTSILLSVGYYVKQWPDHWPTEAYWPNIVIGVGGTLVVWLLVLFIDTNEEMSLHKLPDRMPIIEQSLKYFKSKKALEKGKKDLIVSVQESIIGDKLKLNDDELSGCAGSEWELDRIALYIFERYKKNPALSERIRHVENEFNILERGNWKSSLAPLHYAVESVCDAVENGSSITRKQCEMIEEISSTLNTWKTELVRGWYRIAASTEKPRGEKIIKNCEAIKAKCP